MVVVIQSHKETNNARISFSNSEKHKFTMKLKK
jgi:hypothetical protein